MIIASTARCTDRLSGTIETSSSISRFSDCKHNLLFLNLLKNTTGFLLAQHLFLLREYSTTSHESLNLAISINDLDSPLVDRQ